MTHRIVVLGAGYAGALAAGRLARRLAPQDIDITLVNDDPHFVERVRLHQLATGQQLKDRSLAEALGPDVTVRLVRVTAVDADRRTVEIAGAGADGPTELGYDTLVYALGSTNADHGVPGVAEHTHQVAGKKAALRLADRLEALKPGATVLVVGGGLTAIETVTEIAESRPDLRVAIAARSGIGSWLSDKARAHLSTVFDRLGITVHENTVVTRVSALGVVTGDGEIAADATVWTGGFGVHPIAAATTLAVNETGRIVVDGTMRSVSHPDVYAVGDAAYAQGYADRPLRMSCASGQPMAKRAADSIVARLTGGKVKQGPIPYVLQCISLGRRDGIVQRVTRDDRATNTVLSGRLAARVKEMICAGAAWNSLNPTMGMPSRRRHPAEADRPMEKERR